MKKSSYLTMSIVLVFLFLNSSFIILGQNNTNEIANNKYVKRNKTWYTFVDNKIADRVDTAHIVVKLKNNAVLKENDLLRAGLNDVKIVGEQYAGGFYKLKIVKNNMDNFQIAKRLENSGDFEYVFFSVFYECDAVPNDGLYSTQWHLNKVNIPNSWDITTGSSNIIVAVIDIGGDYNHEDLVTNLWSGIGYDFYDNDSDPAPVGDDYHGTNVAGIIAAPTNNNLGVAGVAGGWNSSNGIKLMHMRVGAGGVISTSAAAQAVDWVVQHGAKIINMSFSGTTAMPDVEAAINKATNNNVICIASAGNYVKGGVTTTPVRYPAKYSNCIAVGATTENDVRKYWDDGTDESHWGSCYGSELDLVAPGIHISTTDQTGSAGKDPSNYNSRFNGTSSATPIVSGTVALLCALNPNLTFQDIYTELVMTADKVTNMNGQSFTNEYGFGRLNSYKAVKDIYDRTVASNFANQNQSIEQTTTAFNNSRKLVKDAGGYYHLVFSTSGEIFYRKSTNGGYNWSSAIRISAGNGFNKYPCITLDHYYGTPSVTWQRETQANTYEIYFAASRDNGNTWNATDRHVVTSLQCSANPLPVIQGTQYGTLKVIAFKGNAGVSAYKTTSLYPASNNDWQVYTISATSQEYNVTLSDDWAYYKTLLAYQDGNPANIKYTFFDGTSWFTPYSLSSIVPGTAIHQTPSIANNPNGSGVHIAWERITNSGSSATDHTIIYRRANSYNDWRNEYYATYYQGQQLPSITCTDLNEVYLLFQLIPSMGNEIYKQFFNGSSWGTPTLVASNSVYPSVSKGKTDAKYIYTTGVSQPYTVTVSSDFLSKQNEQINFNNYSRSIAIMNNPEEYLEVVLNKMYFKMKDGLTQRVDFLPADLEELKTKEKFDLTTANAWDLMKGIKDLTIPVGADELVFDYTVRGENIDKVVEGNPKKIDLSIDLNLTTKTEKAEKINSMDIVRGKITETKFSDVIQLNSVNAERGFDKIEIGLKVKGLTPKTTAFASLGHIFDYTNTDTQNETIASKLNDAEAVSEETLISENYPNPFNPTTLIRFTIKNSSKVTLKIYDVLGREVAELLNGFHESGTYEIPFNGSNLPSGVYFYHLTSSGNSLTKKMLLLK